MALLPWYVRINIQNLNFTKLLFQLQYFLLEIIERFVPTDSAEYETSRLQLTNSTELQLRHSLAMLCSDIKIVNDHNIPTYTQYISNAGFLWPLVGTFFMIHNLCHITKS